jgi:hypothetical protein
MRKLYSHVQLSIDYKLSFLLELTLRPYVCNLCRVTETHENRRSHYKTRLISALDGDAPAESVIWNVTEFRSG